MNNEELDYRSCAPEDSPYPPGEPLLDALKLWRHERELNRKRVEENDQRFEYFLYEDTSPRKQHTYSLLVKLLFGPKLFYFMLINLSDGLFTR